MKTSQWVFHIAAYTVIVLIFSYLPGVLLSWVGGLFSSYFSLVTQCLFPLASALGHFFGSLTEEAVSFHLLEIMVVSLCQSASCTWWLSPLLLLFFFLFGSVSLYQCTITVLCVPVWNLRILSAKCVHGCDHENSQHHWREQSELWGLMGEAFLAQGPGWVVVVWGHQIFADIQRYHLE